MTTDPTITNVDPDDIAAHMRAHIRSRAVLGSLSIKRFDPHKSDRSATAEYGAAHGVDKDMINMRKRTIPREFSMPLQQVERKARVYLDEIGLPFYDRAFRLIPVERLSEVMDKFQDFKSQWDREVLKFISRWPDIVADARIKLNGMFDPRAYPPTEVLHGMFRFQPIFMEIPDDRWSVLPDGVQDSVSASMAELLNERIATAHEALKERMVEEVRRLRDKMGNWVDGSSRLHESTVTRVTKLAREAPALNVFDDPAINQAASAMQEFSHLEDNVTLLKENPEAREIVKAKADKILQNLSL